VEIIRSIDSRNLRATVDIGNYLQCGQEAHEGTAIAAPYASYVHLKDYRKRADGSLPWGWAVEACSLGQGDVDFRQCLEALRTANYDGYLAIEYEGAEDDTPSFAAQGCAPVSTFTGRRLRMPKANSLSASYPVTTSHRMAVSLFPGTRRR
jgi:sugar phosphate isomerase/epimerase